MGIAGDDQGGSSGHNGTPAPRRATPVTPGLDTTMPRTGDNPARRTSLSSLEALVGCMVGSHRVVRRLGAGGMGAVYLAEHPIIGSKVAIKFLHDAVANNPESVQRFFGEARAVNLIGHESLVKVFDLNVHAERYYIVMEHLEGETLAQALHDGSVPLGDALVILLQLCDALHAAHQKGIIHRDIKPANVFLCPRPGRPPLVKLMDFGVAKLRADNARALTEPGAVLGTPSYMAPEQADGRPVDARSDLYSLGVLAYHLATGRVPFEKTTAMEMMLAHRQEKPVEPILVVPELPSRFSDIIMRALEKDPAQRFEDAAEMGRALADVLADLPLHQQPAGLYDVTPRPTSTVQAGLARLNPVSHKRLLRLAVLASVVALTGALATLATVFGWMGKPEARVDVVTSPAPAPKPEPAATPTPAATPPAVVPPVVAQPAPSADPKPARATTSRRATGLLTLQSKPWGRVFIDGVDTGKYTPLANLKVSAGRHTVRLVNDKTRQSATFTVDVAPDGHVRETRNLE